MPVPKFAQYDAHSIQDLKQEVQQLEQRVEQHTHDAGTGLVVYGADWCGWTQKQKKELAQHNVPHKYVNCADDKDKEQCAGISGFPTLKIGGQHHPGFKDAHVIKGLMGQH